MRLKLLLLLLQLQWQSSRLLGRPMEVQELITWQEKSMY
jgi:hypothetical protein